MEIRDVLRIPDSYDAKIANLHSEKKNSVLEYSHMLNSLKYNQVAIWHITGQNVRRLQIFAILAS